MKVTDPDFLLQEYQTIAQAFFNLYGVIDQTFRLYLGVVALPLSVAGVILGTGILPIDFTPYSGWVAPILLFVGLLGVFVTVSLILIRIEMLAYARVINQIRGFFSKSHPEIAPYLRLPTDDQVPPYFALVTYTTFQMAAVGLCNSAAFGLATWLWFPCTRPFPAFALGLCTFALHFVLYWVVCKVKENQWRHRPEFRF